MNRSKLYNLAEECLQQMLAGSSLDEVLAQHPTQAAELRPLLETAWMARSLQSAPPAPAAQNRSRSAFLTAAGQAQSAPKKRWVGWVPALRFSSIAAIVAIALLSTMLLGGGLVSAQSLPGDTLYPVKIAVERARLSLTTDPSTRIALEETFDQERLEESHQLRLLGRSQTVAFAGYLRRDSDEGWKVGELELTLSPELAAQAAALEGMYVEVQGQVDEDEMLVQLLQVRTFELTGVVEKIETGEWKVGGVKVHLLMNTEIRVQARPGDMVRVLAMRQRNEDLVALVITSPQDTSASQNSPLPANILLTAPAPLPASIDEQTPEADHMETDEPEDDSSKIEATEDTSSDDSPDEPESQETPQPEDDAQDQNDDSTQDDGDSNKEEDKESDDNSGPKR